jgi:phage shock protein C
MEQRRLYRSKTDKVIGGVCGGLGAYLNADPVLFRILFAVGAILGGGGLIIYLVLWIVVPEQEGSAYYESNQKNMENKEFQEAGFSENEGGRQHKSDGNLWAGIILITIGGLFLMDRFIPRINFGDLWPVLLIVIGVILIGRNFTLPKDGVTPKK